MEQPVIYKVLCQKPWSDAPKYAFIHPKEGYMCGMFEDMGHALRMYQIALGNYIQPVFVSFEEFEELKTKYPKPEVEIPDFTR